MTDREKFSLIRGAVFLVGAILLAAAIGLSWLGVVGAGLMASAIPGMLQRREPRP